MKPPASPTPNSTPSPTPAPTPTPPYDPDNPFAKILRKEIPAQLVFEDERCVAFRDITPQAPAHALVIPKAQIARLADAQPRDEGLLGHLLLAAAEVARRLGVGDAYRVVVNNGAGAGQSVFHLHLHVLGGRNFRWPPG